MSSKRWRDTDHLGRTGGPRRFAAQVGRRQREATGLRMDDMRRRRGFTRAEVARRMGVTVARITRIEGGDVSSVDELADYIAAIGGRLVRVADFGDEQVMID
jgi:DNA-binding XRE family transcriptional regulator